MIKHLSGIALATLVCASTSAQTLEDRVLELERRVGQLESQVAQPNAPVIAKPAATKSDGWRQRESGRALKRGMSDGDVRSLLGEAISVNVYGPFSVWQYPEGGRVQFDSKDQVEGWIEPR
jgi:hypothetical protein